MRVKFLIMLCLVLAQKIMAQDSLSSKTLHEVVISSTKFELPVEKSGKIVFKISPNDLEKNSGRSLPDMLNQVPGVQMDGNFSSPGANISYYVRGGRNKHSLILLDGVPMIDPSGIDPSYDLRFLSLDQVDNIEVLQGSLSTLYGSGAAAGVISIQTKKSDQNGIQGSIAARSGSWSTFNQSLNLNGRLNKTAFMFSAGNYSTEGFSAAQDNDPVAVFDKDGLTKRNFYLSVSHDFSPSFSMSAFSGHDWLDNEFDANAFVDAPNSQEYKQFRLGIKNTFRYAKGNIDLVVQRNDIDRNEKTSSLSKYEGVNWYGEVINRHEVSSIITLLSGVSYQKLIYNETNVNEEDTTFFTLVDPYTSILIGLPNGLNIHAGLRLNTHSMYGNQLLYNFNPFWMVKVGTFSKVKFLASVSTAYITPSLYQLYTTWGGNRNLKAEDDFNVEYGATFYFKDKIEFTAVNYYRVESNAIVYSAAYQYENANGNRYVNGVTLNTSLKVLRQLKVSADYAYTSSNLPSTFYRIPNHKAGAALEYQPVKSSSLCVRYQYTGQRKDSYYPADSFFPEEVTLQPFSLVDITASQKLLHNKLTAYVTIANLFDEDYIAVYGYTTRGRNFSAGLNFSF